MKRKKYHMQVFRRNKSKALKYVACMYSCLAWLLAASD